jgi:hypothetical protein
MLVLLEGLAYSGRLPRYLAEVEALLEAETVSFREANRKRRGAKPGFC